MQDVGFSVEYTNSSGAKSVSDELINIFLLEMLISIVLLEMELHHDNIHKLVTETLYDFHATAYLALSPLWIWSGEWFCWHFVSLLIFLTRLCNYVNLWISGKFLHMYGWNLQTNMGQFIFNLFQKGRSVSSQCDFSPLLASSVFLMNAFIFECIVRLHNAGFVFLSILYTLNCW